MICILSPARNTRPYALPGEQTTGILFPDKVQRLVSILREYSPWQLESLLDVPPDRALELHRQYACFDPSAPGTPALRSFRGMAYIAMDAAGLTPSQMEYAQGHLRILSALYGMLRPLDGILPHRLGLKKEFQPQGGDLHAFWGDVIYQSLYAHGDMVVNLASLDYARLVTPFLKPGDRMITCRFLVDKPGGPRGTVSTVRTARGLMSGFILRNRIDRPKDLQDFDLDGYRYDEVRSSSAELVFVKSGRDAAQSV